MNKILVAIDGSDHAWKALDLAAELAKAHGARLLVLHVVPYEPVSEALRAFAAAENIPLEEARGRFHEARTLGDRLTRRAEAIARDKGVEAVESRTAEGSPADEILAMAKAEGVDMIVLGTRGLSRPKALFLGSVSHKVVNQAECTCVTVK
ncbi:MAG TPA: universal stress protein [Geminicoccaceae bacterium]|nr:universal stress protein [Geminicoccaceae bacterium]